jgi:cobalamin biosynthesis Mg chelatase CobN
VRYRGQYGLVSEVYSATVLLDREAPALLLSSPEPDSVVRSRQLTLAGTVADANGVESIEVSVDGGEWTSIPVQATWSTVVDLGDWGSHTLTVRARDVAGNLAEASILVKAEEDQALITSSGSLALVLIVLILCVTAIVLVWMMKRGGPPLEDR